MIGSHQIDQLHVVDPFCESTSLLVNQQTFHILSNLQYHHACSSLPHVPVLTHISPIHVCHSVSWRTMIILSPILCLGLPSGLSVSVSWTDALNISFPHACYVHLIFVCLFMVCLIPQTTLWRAEIMNMLII